MDDGRIHYRLDLLVRVMDATTGRPVEDSSIRFYKDDKLVSVFGRGEGCYIFLNSGRENHLMRIEVYGFETRTMAVDYEKLEPQLPSVDVFLIPSERLRRGAELRILRGRLSGLETVEALHPGRFATSIREFDAKKRIMTVFSPNRRVDLTRQYYGLLHADRSTFEVLDIKEEISDNKVRLRTPIQEEFSPNAPLCNMVFGQVEDDGSYMLAVRDDGKDLTYLVKYIVNGEKKFKKIDFHNLEGVELD